MEHVKDIDFENVNLNPAVKLIPNIILTELQAEKL